MKNIIIKNGILATAIIISIQVIAYLIFGLPEGVNFDRDEIVGYGGIMLCMPLSNSKDCCQKEQGRNE